jgi:hypothetical protein
MTMSKTLNESIVEDAALAWFGELGYAVGHGLHPSRAMSRPIPAPTGHDAIAQGIALGYRPQTFPSPEGAQGCTGIRRVASRGDGFRPYRAGNHFWYGTQGDALGCHILPLRGKNQGGVLGCRIMTHWGKSHGDALGFVFGELGYAFERGLHPSRAMSLPFPSPTGRDAIAQGIALGIRPQTFPSPEGA